MTGDVEEPKVAITVASSCCWRGIEAAGVSVIVSVADWPTASDAGARPLSNSPEGRVSASDDSGTLPTFVRVSVSVIGAPGVVFKVEGLLVTVTASTSGTVIVSVDELVTAVLVELDALMPNDSVVPGAGSGPVGIRYSPISAVAPAGISICDTLVTAVKPAGMFVGLRLKCIGGRAGVLDPDQIGGR